MASRRAEALVKGGLVVTGQGAGRYDILVEGGKVKEMAPDLSDRAAVLVIDATGRYVLPGAIDAHTHPVYADKMDTFSICAAYGGITTVIAFVGNVKSWGFSGYTTDIVKGFIEEGERLSYLDFAAHGTYSAADEETLARSIPELVRLGVPSFKVFMAYKRRGMMISDEAILRAMDAAATEGGLTMVHAETGCCIEFLMERYISQGKTGPEWFLPAQPNILEAEALNRAATFARIVDTPLYPVHLSTKEAMPVAQRFREDGGLLFTETCPHYLTLTNEEILKKGPIAKVGPPLREQSDADALWKGLAEGTIDVVGSDAGGFTRARKTAGAASENIFEAPYGLNTVEFMVPVVWSHGVNRGRISLPRLVQVFCENPAKIFGIYPQKGTLQAGSDADLVLWDPTRLHKVQGQHGNTDYSSFDGFELLGMPDLVMQRGQVIIKDGKVVGKQGVSKFVKGNPNATPYAPRGHKLG
jgi:dihydropyrimidinase